MNGESFADDRFDAHSRIEGVERILEDHLDSFSVGEKLFSVEVADVVFFEKDFAGGDLVEADDCASDGGFSASAFADEADGFAAGDGEGDAIDGFDVIDDSSEDTSVDWKVNFQVFDFENGIVFRHF